MKPRDGYLEPVWYKAANLPKYPAPLAKTLTADVCVVGAGLAGLTTAYLLAGEGKSVIVLDEGAIASGQTGRTSAHLGSAIDDRFTEIERLHGQENSKFAYQSHAAAIDKIEQITRDEKIDCDFKRLDAYLFPDDGQSADSLKKELEAAKRAGFKDVEFQELPALRSWNKMPALRFGNQARFHPLKYIAGLAKACERRGVKIYTGCRVKDVQGANAKKHTPATATIDEDGGKVEATAIVVATNAPAPINDWLGIYLKQSSYRSYMIGLKVPANSVDDLLYWDDADPYHYVRLEAGRTGGDILLVGGADHKTGQQPKEDPFKSLENWARVKFPQAGDVVTKWSGQVQEPDDYLAYIGKAPTSGEDVYVITGDSGMGLTHGTLGAILITDLIQNRLNPWANLYDPNRNTWSKDFVKENANTMMQYADLVTGGDVKSADDIPIGDGAVLREGIHKIAAFKKSATEVVRCSALCTHLQCVVHWNNVEKSWDCPCHGSRFSADGKVLMGPAVDDLKPAE